MAPTAASPAQLKARRREDYRFMLEYRTRWNDNDMYDHMNNSVYNFLFDSVLNAYLIEHCKLHPPTAKEFGLCVHTHTDYFASIAYPAVAELTLRVNKLGRSSVTYEMALFEKGVDEVKAVLGPTIEVEHAHVRFLGNLVLHLWDCGGQESFMDNYLVSQKDQVFKNVQVLIYVFDVESREFVRDLRYYQSCLEALLHNSPSAQVFCLVHKMDLIEESKRDAIFAAKEEEIKNYSKLASGAERANAVIQCFRSSIWDETLYKAWSAIVYKLIPNVNMMEEKLRQFAQIVDADEVLLFERATFLVIAHAELKEHRDVHRFEKVSNIIKQFKLSCSKMSSQFEYMHVRNSHFSAFIDTFTPNTFIMVILSDGNVSPAATLMNIKSARKHFEKLEAR